MQKHLTSQKSKLKKAKIIDILMKKKKSTIFYRNNVESITIIKAKNQKIELFIT